MAENKTEEGKMMGNMMGAVMGFAMLMVVLGLVMGFTPAVTYYTCPICDAQFTSMADLEAHFATEHPAIDIDIDWQ